MLPELDGLDEAPLALEGLLLDGLDELEPLEADCPASHSL